MENKIGSEWFIVTRDLKTKRIIEPERDIKDVLFWVKKSFAPQDDLLWYDYGLFDSNLDPASLIIGNFTCLKMYEIVPKTAGMFIGLVLRSQTVMI